ncbi:FAD-dependent monooxygenase [Streptomyces bungoensis]
MDTACPATQTRRPEVREEKFTSRTRGPRASGAGEGRPMRTTDQVPAGTRAEEWTDDALWAELERRVETGDDWRLERGPVTQKSVTPMRSFVHEPMRHGRLFPAGDAAHIVPPTGAKGLNLAVGDVVTFARALVHQRETGSADLLDAYSATCLARVWQAERFSFDMTTLLHRAPDATPFDTRLDRIAGSRAAETDLAEAYTGFRLG